MSDEIEEFGDVGAGASTTYPQQCSALRKGGHVMIKGKSRPMYVVHFFFIITSFLEKFPIFEAKLSF